MAHVRIDGDEPMTEIGCESESAPLAVRVVVATEPSFAGDPFVVVQYESCPDVSDDDVEMEPVELIVTAPVAPEIVTLEPARIDVTPELVNTPELLESPEPRSELKELFPMTRLVVEAVVKDAYVDDEYANVWLAVQVLEFAMFKLKALPLYESPAPAVVVAELNLL